MAHTRLSILPLLALWLLLPIGPRYPACRSAQGANPLQESDDARNARMQWWREARFGMFIHWGVYAVLAGEYQGQRANNVGEWIKAWADISNEEYDKLLDQFNPVHFDAARWVRLAKQAGMQYIVITSKHHDGFCLFETQATEYDIVDGTPFGKDVLRALERSCKKEGIRLCFYYSIMDWHHPTLYADPKEIDQRHLGVKKNLLRKGQKPRYIDYMKTQLAELITRYDPGVLWFDGEWVDWWTEPDGKDLYSFCRGLKPELIINNRVGKGRDGMKGFNKDDGYVGDFGTPEQEIPPTGMPGVDWETCMTINTTWGYKHYDHDWKSTKALIRHLIDIASKGGNFLLNVGPKADGTIPQPTIERLEGIGKWMQKNGSSIYGTTASPFTHLSWGRCTQKPGALYLHVFDWPGDGRLIVPKIDNQVQQAYLLAQGKSHPLQFTSTDTALVLQVPPQSPNPIATVVVLNIDGPVQIATP